MMGFDLARNRVAFFLAVLCLVLSACGGPDQDDAELLQRGRAYLKDNDYNAAAIELRNALQLNPGNAEARFLLGTINMHFGDFVTAEKEFHRAGKAGWDPAESLNGIARSLLGQDAFRKVLKQVEISEDFTATEKANLLALRALAEAGLGNLQQAELVVGEAAKLDAAALQVLKVTVQLQLAQGDLDKARGTLADALERYPDQPELLLLGGSIASRSGDTAAAAAAYQRVIDLDPPGFVSVFGRNARLELAQQQILDRQLDQAEETIRPLYRRNANDPYLNYLGGVLAFSRGEYDLAKGRLLKVLKLAPEHNPTRLLFGTVNFAQQDYEQAVYFLAKYVAAVPDNLEARKLLGRSYLMLGQYEDARKILQSAPTDKQADAELLALAGLSELRRGHTAAGIAGLENAVAADPESVTLRSQLARAYIATGETGHAIEELKRILADGSQQKGTESLLVLANLQSGSFDQAIHTALDMVKKYPDDPAVLTLAGNTFALTGDAQAARRYFLEARAMAPDFLPAGLALAKVEEQAGDMDAAVALYEDLVRSSKQPYVPMLVLARIAEQKGDSQGMVAWLEKAIASAPQEVGPRISLAGYYLREKNPEKARLLVTEASGIAPNNPDVLAMQGRMLMAEGKYREALHPLRALLEREPWSVAGRIQLAECYLELVEPENARKHLVDVLEQFPESAPALALMTRLEIQAGNIDQAQVYCRHIQQQFPEMYLGYELEGDARKAANDLPGARAAYLQARELNPSGDLAIKLARVETGSGNPAKAAEVLEDWLTEHTGDIRVRQFLGDAYLDMGQDEKAVQAYEQVLAADPKNQVALNNLAWLYMLADNPAALPLAERAYRADSANPGVMDTYGWLLVRDGQVARGLGLLRQAVARLPKVPEVRYHYAAALYQAGDREQGRRLIKALLQEHAAFTGRDAAVALIEK